jgi:3-methyladenine DNA glycosylase AlkD
MIKLILDILNDAANPDLAPGFEAYLKNRHKCFGIITPTRREICKPVMENCIGLSKKETVALARQLYKQPQRECHYLALELLEQKTRQCAKKKHSEKLEREDIEWMEHFVLTHSWWDTVDVVAPKIMSHYFMAFPGERQAKTSEWIKSGNTWLIRSALLFQLKYKAETDLDLLFQTILRVCHTKEFFINKAIGWILRENAKRVPSTIYHFIGKNEKKLSPLSVREGLKHKTS